MVASRAHDAVMVCRFEAARRLNNAVLGDGLKALALMRESKAWTAAKAMPKGEPKSAVRDARNDAFKACNRHFGFTEYALQAVATVHKNAAGFDNRLGAHETQKIASRIFASLQEYAFGKRGRPRFKGKHRPLHSMEGKSNAAGPRWHADTATVSWGWQQRLLQRVSGQERCRESTQAIPTPRGLGGCATAAEACLVPRQRRTA